MKKKLLVRSILMFSLCIFFIAATCFVSYADVVWEPEDSFYQKHADECRYVDEELIANGPGGKVIIWKSPVSDTEIGSIENGSKVFVDFTYTDKRGYRWGIVYRNDMTGWVPMNYLIVEPGYLNFVNKHSDEYQKYEGHFVPEGVTEVIFWTYPGSGEIRNRISVDEDDAISVERSYTDNEGRQWGLVGYFKANDGWICMSDPSNDQIPLNEEDAADVVIPSEPDVIITPQPDGANILILIAVLVVAVAAGTFILIRVLFKGKASKRADAEKAP